MFWNIISIRPRSVKSDSLGLRGTLTDLDSSAHMIHEMGVRDRVVWRECVIWNA